MKIRRLLMGAGAVVALSFGLQTANAALICMGCEYMDQTTYLGLYNPETFDGGQFNHDEIQDNVGFDTNFVDYWVFDIDPNGRSSISANFTALAPIDAFAARLFVDGGTDCTGAVAGGACVDVAATVGLLLDSAADSGNEVWEIVSANLAAGRYVLEVTGITNAGPGPSIYSGQLAFAPVPEPTTLALLSLGLLGAGATVVRQRRRNK